MPARVVATTAAALVMAPAYAGPALVAPANPRLNNAMDSYRTCAIRPEVEKLNALPSSNLAIPLDITPAILASSHHRAIASGYHRNVSGIHDVIVIFAGQPDQARAILARRQIDYVVFCPNAPESIRWEMHGPGGLASMLNAGRAPEWLQPVDLQTRGLRIWRVRNEVPATP
jgi:hypothetical protein